MKEDRISIYAELLSNIRQVSIAASLPSPPGPRTVAKVFDGGRRLCIEHDGQTEALDLPGTVFGNTTLQVSQSASRELTWRLPLSSEGTPFPHFSPETQAVPWVASDLEHGSAIYCRSCNSIVIPKDTIESWKDLPSENWAEMMEFWHCHKPHDHSEHQQESLADRGYGANSVITAQPGTGFVDITSFMFDETNCQNLLFSMSTLAKAARNSSDAVADAASPKFLHIFCSECKAEIGLFNMKIGSVTLFKWQVKCNTTVPNNRVPSGPECLAASLVANISRSGSAKSLISAHASEKGENLTTPLYLWVLNPNVVYSSSFIQGKKTAMKVLYQQITAEEGDKLTDSIVLDVQDLSLPTATIQLSREILKSSNRLLPEKERSFKEWQVGLLDRWDGTR
ncbi:uncharacterized protein G6M90_00g100470 [Metarhizium brunneum]|uniref:Ubiquitin-conjugating enzyme E2C-binding protein n=1 Tax=Metarhizium brunneum TaxID=500148 RepID=A0A7D5V4K0_9HYPO